jgi:Uma2 family endonuclease
VVELKVGRETVTLPYTVRIKGVTEEMFDELVDEDTRAELLDGVMIVHSPASIEHDDVSGFVRTLMRLYAEEMGLGKVFGPDSLIHLATSRKFAPDIYFLTTDRVPTPLPQEFEGAPDLIVEVVSPSNRDDDLLGKRRAYREAKVRELWLIDEENQQVIIDRRRKRRYAEKIVTEGQADSEVMAGFWLDVSWLWSEPLPNTLQCLQAILGSV